MTEKYNTWIMQGRDSVREDFCHYVPKEQFLGSLKKALENFLFETNEKKLTYMVETTDGNPRQILKGVPVKVEIVEDEIQITAHKSFTFKATEYGWGLAGYFRTAKRFYINKGGEFALYVHCENE